ncbi:MAG: type II toxin-antitoxin system Phd/YefM family antitoxin [Desulfococcaceae bacterium]
MEIFNIQDAIHHLPRLVEQAAKGEPFAIAKEGKPIVKVIPMDVPEPRKKKRLGFMTGQINVPEDFDRMGSTEIECRFGTDA